MNEQTAEVTYAQQVIDKIHAALPGIDSDLGRLYSLLALVAGESTTLEDVHDAWAIWRTATRPDHASLVPFGRLAADVQELDRPYMQAIREVAKAVGR